MTKQKGWRLIIVMILGLAVMPMAYANAEQYHFANTQDQQRFHKLSKELRCSTNQSQSVAESAYAIDMRVQIYQMIINGASDQAILDYLSYRYGKQILCDPVDTTKSWLLWIVPSGLLLAGIFTGVWLYRAARNTNMQAKNI